MPHPQFDRNRLDYHPLSERKDRDWIEKKQVRLTDTPAALDASGAKLVEEAVARLRGARESNAPRMLAFGAHTIKNGLAPVLIHLIETGWLTHLATNGAGVIHDWEFAYQGHSSENVQENIAEGTFGMWQETGFYVNLAITAGAWRGLGYGEAVGAFVGYDGVDLPDIVELREHCVSALREGEFDVAASGADLMSAMINFDLNRGKFHVAHGFKQFSVQAAAHKRGIPFTAHPMIGHDIIYEHAMNNCAAIGRAAQRDFLTFAEGVSRLNGGVYLSIGSAVMSPMIFEKCMSMGQNLAIQRGKKIQDFHILVVDLQPSTWDWTQGEPPESHPDYYMRFNKSFSRVGGQMRYLQADNRDFLLHLAKALAT